MGLQHRLKQEKLKVCFKFIYHNKKIVKINCGELIEVFQYTEKSSPVSSSDKMIPERPKKSKLRRAAAAVYESLLRQSEEDDESDSNDENFEGGEINSSDEENVNGVEESSNDGKFFF